MFNFFGPRSYKVNHVDVAMGIFNEVYLNEIRNKYSSEQANMSASVAAENYMTQYLSFKERGL